MCPKSKICFVINVKEFHMLFRIIANIYLQLLKKLLLDYKMIMLTNGCKQNYNKINLLFFMKEEK